MIVRNRLVRILLGIYFCSAAAQAVSAETAVSVQEAVQQSLHSTESITYGLLQKLNTLSDKALWEGLSFKESRSGLQYYVRLLALDHLLIRSGIHVPYGQRPDLIPVSMISVAEPPKPWHVDPLHRQMLFDALADPQLPASHHLFYVAALEADPNSTAALTERCRVGTISPDPLLTAESLIRLWKNPDSEKAAGGAVALNQWAKKTIWTSYLSHRDQLAFMSDHARFLADTIWIWQAQLIDSVLASVKTPPLHTMDLWILSQGMSNPAPMLALTHQADKQISIPAQRAILWMATREVVSPNHLTPKDVTPIARAFLHQADVKDQQLALKAVRGWANPIDDSWLSDLLPLTQSTNLQTRQLALGCLPAIHKNQPVIDLLRQAFKDSDVETVGWALYVFQRSGEPPAWSAELLSTFLKTETPERLTSLRWKNAYVTAGRLLEKITGKELGFSPKGPPELCGLALLQQGQRNTILLYDQWMLEGLSTREAAQHLSTPQDLLPLPPNGSEKIPSSQVAAAIAHLPKD